MFSWQFFQALGKWLPFIRGEKDTEKEKEEKKKWNKLYRFKNNWVRWWKIRKFTLVTRGRRPEHIIRRKKKVLGIGIPSDIFEEGKKFVDWWIDVSWKEIKEKREMEHDVVGIWSK